MRMTTLKTWLTISVFLFVTACTAFAGQIIYVDADGSADFNNVQAAIDDSNDGDTIIVAQGEYNESINYHGKAITVKSEEGPYITTIRGAGGSVATFNSGETQEAVLEGFTLTGGTGIRHNWVICGGGIFCVNGSSPTIARNIITRNTATSSACGNRSGGGGIYCENSHIVIMGNIITKNSTSSTGGAICSVDSQPIIANNTIVENAGRWRYGGISFHNSEPFITNSIIYANYIINYPWRSQENISGVTSEQISHCLIGDGQFADENGNISGDPLFVDQEGDNFHLLPDSPCIDRGTNDITIDLPIDIDSEPRISDGDLDSTSIIDMGADELYIPSTTATDIFCKPKVDFGFTTSEEPYPQETLKVWNIGTQNLIIDDIRIEGADAGDFRLSTAEHLPISVPLLGNVAIQLEFRPTTPGKTSQAELVIISNDPDEPDLRISLQGHFQGVIHVPTDYPTIQEGIDAACDGDIVLVASQTGYRTYYESVDFKGKKIKLLADSDRRPTIHGHVDMGSDATISGFRITSGSAGDGGGIYCSGLNIEISENIIVENTADPGYGGGMCCYGRNIIIRDNIIKHNYNAEAAAEGIYAEGSDFLIEGNIITENDVCGGGEAICIKGSNFIIRNNIIARNIDAEGVCCYDSSNILIEHNTIVGNELVGIRNYRSDITVKNCIVWGNSTRYGGYDVGVDPSKVLYCLVPYHPEYCGRNGNICGDPEFVDFEHGDYHLLPNSPCINAGDPDYVPEPNETDLDGMPRVAGGRIDMGAYEYEIQPPRTLYVDDDAPNDPGPGDPGASDTLEDGTQTHPFDAIQEAVDTAGYGDTIIVLDGTYTGTGNCDIDFRGKPITVKSKNGPGNCIINANGTEADPHRGFRFHRNENAGSVLNGFTVTSGYARSGGAIYCGGTSSPTLTNCIITNSVAEHEGGGLYNRYGNPTLTNCTFTRNAAAQDGGGMQNDDGSPTLTNCTFIRNFAGDEGGGMCNEDTHAPLLGPILTNCIFISNSADDGGGMANDESSPTLANCTFSGNSADRGGAMYNEHGSSPTLTNCILWADIPGEIYDNATTAIATYSDVQGGWQGLGNIDTDPCFARLGNWQVEGDYHLKSQAGRWDANEGRWTKDEVTSQCIDAGDMSSPIGYEPFPNGGRVNMGAYGGTAEASKSYFGEPVCETIVAGDINGDCIVNFKDFALMALHWLQDNTL